MSSRMLIASDLHLSQTIWRNRDDIAGDSYFGLKEIYAAAVKYEVQQIALLGDIFDTCTPAAEDVVAYREFCDKARAKNIRIYYIEGQHDRSSFRSETKCRIPGWCDVDSHPVHAHDKIIQVTDEINAYCMDWQHRDDLKYKLDAIPKNCSWLFCHQAWAELMGAEARSDGAFTDIPGHITSVFTGDKHQHGVFLHRNNSLKVHSPGCTHIRKKNEPTESRIFLVQDGITRTIPIRSRIVRTFKILTLADTEKVKEALSDIKQPENQRPEPIDKPIFFVNYTREFVNYIRSLRDIKDVFIISTLINTDAENFQKQQDKQHNVIAGGAPLDDIKTIMRKALHTRCGDDQDLYNFGLSLLEDKSPKKAIEAMINALERE